MSPKVSLSRAPTLLRPTLVAISLTGQLSCSPAEQQAGLGPQETPLASLVVTSERATITVSETVTLRARGWSASGKPVPVSIVWRLGAGTLIPLSDSVAQFSAPIPGTYTIIASLDNSELADTASILVIGDSNTAEFPHEPSGLVTPYTITAPQPNPFDQLPRAWNAADGKAAYALDAYGWMMEGSPAEWQNAAIVADPVRGNVMRIKLPAGMPGGGSPVKMVAGGGHVWGLSKAGVAPFQPTRMFWGYYAKLSANWTDVNQVTKLNYVNTTALNGGNGSAEGNWLTYLTYQSKPYLTAGMAAQTPATPTYAHHSATGHQRNEWHKFEWYVVLNDVGVANGVLKCWVDGVLELDYSNLYLINSTRNIDWITFELIYGGGLTPVSEDMYAYFDNWYLTIGE